MGVVDTFGLDLDTTKYESPKMKKIIDIRFRAPCPDPLSRDKNQTFIIIIHLHELFQPIFATESANMDWE